MGDADSPRIAQGFLGSEQADLSGLSSVRGRLETSPSGRVDDFRHGPVRQGVEVGAAGGFGAFEEDPGLLGGDIATYLSDAVGRAFWRLWLGASQRSEAGEQDDWRPQIKHLEAHSREGNELVSTLSKLGLYGEIVTHTDKRVSRLEGRSSRLRAGPWHYFDLTFRPASQTIRVISLIAGHVQHHELHEPAG